VGRWSATGQAQGGSLPPGEASSPSTPAAARSTSPRAGHGASRTRIRRRRAPDFGGAIGVTADGVEGVDITVPVFQFSETHYFTDDAGDPSYKGALFNSPAR
jgi:hypothetical protein